jgi:hypothetical protein
MRHLKSQRGTKRLNKPFRGDQQDDSNRTGSDAVEADSESQERVGLGESCAKYRGVL